MNFYIQKIDDRSRQCYSYGRQFLIQVFRSFCCFFVLKKMFRISPRVFKPERGAILSKVFKKYRSYLLGQRV